MAEIISMTEEQKFQLEMLQTGHETRTQPQSSISAIGTDDRAKFLLPFKIPLQSAALIQISRLGTYRSGA